MTDALAELSAAGRVHLARRHQPRAPAHRQPGRPDPRQARRRRHDQPDDLPEGARRRATPTTTSSATSPCAASTSTRPSARSRRYDIRWACDVLRPVYDATDGVDGRVSIEVDPRLAHDTREDRGRGAGAVVAGRPAQPVHQDPGDRARACRRSRRPRRGHQRQRHADLLARALRRGHGRLPRPAWSRRRPAGHDLSDDRLGRVVLRLPRRHRDRQAARQDRHRRGRGSCAARPAIANARLAYQRYEEVFATDALAGARGRRRASPQRPLWASTGVKDPPTTTRCTSSSWSPAARQHDAGGDPRRGRRPRRDHAATPCAATTSDARKTMARAGRRSASTTTTSSRCSRTRAWRSSRPPGTSCSSSTARPAADEPARPRGGRWP